MALTATIHKFEVQLSDVDRGVYESLELTLARHPSESMRYLLTRTLAYCLSYEDGVAFSPGGLSSAEEAPLAVWDPTGRLLAWIDVGAPSAERLHKAMKAADRVELYTTSDLVQLRKDAAAGAIHKVDDLVVWRLDPSLLDALEPVVGRRCALDVLRTEGQLYITVADQTHEGAVTQERLTSPA